MDQNNKSKMNVFGQKHLRALHEAAFHLWTYQIIPKNSLYIFLKDGSFHSIVLVRQSLKLCQNTSYPRCHPDLNNLERQNTTHTERRNHLLTTAAFKEAASPTPSLLPEASFSSGDKCQSSLVWLRNGEEWAVKSREGEGKETWNILQQLHKESSLSVCGLGKKSLFLFSFLISNRLFTPFYKLESLCCSKGSKTNHWSARIKLLCYQRLADLLVVLTSSATAEYQMILKILVLFWPKPYECL